MLNKVTITQYIKCSFADVNFLLSDPLNWQSCTEFITTGCEAILNSCQDIPVHKKLAGYRIYSKYSITGTDFKLEYSKGYFSPLTFRIIEFSSGISVTLAYTKQSACDILPTSNVLSACLKKIKILLEYKKNNRRNSRIPYRILSNDVHFNLN